MNIDRAHRRNIVRPTAPTACRRLSTSCFALVACLAAGSLLHAGEETSETDTGPTVVPYEEAPWTVLIVPHGHSLAASAHAVQFLGDQLIERHSHLVFGDAATPEAAEITPGPESTGTTEIAPAPEPAPTPAPNPAPAPVSTGGETDASPAAPPLPFDAESPESGSPAPQSTDASTDNPAPQPATPDGELPPADTPAPESLPDGAPLSGEAFSGSWPALPGHHGHGFHGPHRPDPARYAAIYHSIPFSRVEYAANPSYRHDATMEILFGQLRPTTIHKHHTPREFTLAPPLTRRHGIQWFSRYRRYRGLWGYTYLPPYLPHLGGYGPYTP